MRHIGKTSIGRADRYRSIISLLAILASMTNRRLWWLKLKMSRGQCGLHVLPPPPRLLCRQRRALGCRMRDQWSPPTLHKTPWRWHKSMRTHRYFVTSGPSPRGNATGLWPSLFHSGPMWCPHTGLPSRTTSFEVVTAYLEDTNDVNRLVSFLNCEGR